MRALRLLLITLTLTGLGISSSADEKTEDTSYAREGVYVSVSGVYILERWENAMKHAGAHNTQGINVRVGSRINPWASVEVQFELIDNFKPTGTKTYGMLSSSVNTKVYPFAGRFQPYLLGGLGVLATLSRDRGTTSIAHGSNADWAIRSGGGMDLYFTPQVGVSFEAVHVFTIGEIKNNDHYSMGAGVFYRF